MKRAKNHPRRSRPIPRPVSHGELHVRIACRGRRAAPVLLDLDRAFRRAEDQGLDPLVVLDDLGGLADSVAALLKGISRRLVGYRKTVTFWETSGYTEAFLNSMDGRKLRAG